MGGRQGSNAIFFQIYNEVPGVKKRGGPVALPTGDRTLSPTPGATAPPLFFYSRDFVANLKKKYI